MFDELTAWNEHPDAGIRYFSGTARYHQDVVLTDEQAAGPVLLELGDLRNLAEVVVNGQAMGVVWKSPWRQDVTDVVIPGTNELDIDVTNVWTNRLIGDVSLPAQERNIDLRAERRRIGQRQPTTVGRNPAHKLHDEHWPLRGSASSHSIAKRNGRPDRRVDDFDLNAGPWARRERPRRAGSAPTRGSGPRSMGTSSSFVAA